MTATLDPVIDASASAEPRVPQGGSARRKGPVLFGPYAAAVCLLAISIGAFEGSFDGTEYLARSMAAGVVAGLVTLFARRLRSRLLVVLASAAAALALVHVASAPADQLTPTLANVRSSTSAIANGWGAFLSVGLPAADTQRFLVVPVVQAVVAGVLLGSVLPRLKTWLVLAALTGFVLVNGFLASPQGPPAWTLVSSGTAVVLLLAGFEQRSRSIDARTSVRRIVRWTALATVLAGLAAAVLGAAFGPPRTTRDPIDVPTDELATIAPLMGLRSLVHMPQTADGRGRLIGRVAGPPTQRITFTTLDTFDGIGWTTSAQFAVAGPVFEASTGIGRTVAYELQFASEVAPWLPRIGVPTRLSGVDALSAPSGDLVVAFAGPSSYRLRAVVSDPTVEAIASAPESRNPRYVELPANTEFEAAYAALREIADQLSSPNDPVGRRLLSIEASMQQWKYDSNSPPGAGLAEIQQTVFNSRAGTAENFASAFALIARLMGLPSRVAYGAQIPLDRQGAPESVCDRTAAQGAIVDRRVQRALASTAEVDVAPICSTDLHAWVEVEFDGLGWVAFDPTPPRTQADLLAPPFEPAPNQPDEQPDAPIDETSDDVPPPDLLDDDDSDRQVSVVAVAVTSGIAALLVLVLTVAAVIVVAKRRRRARLRSGTPDDRVIAAWNLAEDRLIEAGFGYQPWLPARTIARDAQPVIGDVASQAAAGLGLLLDRALYSPAGCSDADAVESHSLIAEFERAAGRHRGLVHRPIDLLDPRPLIVRSTARWSGRLRRAWTRV